MPLPDSFAGQLVLALACGPLLAAAVFDLAKYRIPNVITGMLAGLFPVAALMAPLPVDWLDHLAGGALTFAVTAGFFAMRWIGGGDAKLLSALALWTGIGQLVQLLLVITMMGGLFALLLWAARRLRPALPGPLSCELLRHGAPIPYGVAIAAGGLLLAPRLPLLA